MHLSIMVMALDNHLTPFVGRRARGPSQEEGKRERERREKEKEEGKEMRKERGKGWWVLPHVLQFQTKTERMALPELPVVKGCVTQALLFLQVHRAPLRRAERKEPWFKLGAPPLQSHTN